MTYIGVSPSNGVRRVHTYTASGSQTTFTGASSEGITLSYTDANFMDVYQNGVLLAPDDYTATSGTSVVLAEGAAASDIVTITVYDAFSVADTVSKSAGGTFDGNVAMAGTLGVTGVLTGTSLDISGNIDVDGTTNLDVVDIDGAVDMATTLTLAGNADFNGDLDVDGTTNLDVVDIDGAVDMASTLGVTGVVTANAGVVVDNITIDGTEIDLSSGDLTLDVAGTIILNADSGSINLADAGTTFAELINSSSDLIIKSSQSDKDIIFKGVDGGALIEAMRIDMSAGGNVGIGTSSPSATYTTNLQLHAAGGNGAALHLTNSTSGSAGSDGFHVIGFQNDAYLYNRESSGNMIFGTANNEQMRLTSGGDLLVNTSTDTSGGFSVQTISNNTTSTRMLAHGFSVRNNWGSATNLGQGIFSPAGSTLAFSTASTERMRIDSSGNVGIAHSNPDQKLTVNGHINLPTGNSYFYGAGHNVFQVDSTRTYFYGGTNGIQIRKSDNSTALVVVNDSGNVGIGTSSPDSFGSNTSDLVVGTTSGEHGMTIASGTANSGRIQFADNTSSPFVGAIEYAHGSINAMIFYTNAGERMRIHSSGQVGIGQTANQATLCIFGHQQSYTGLQIKNGTNNGSTFFGMFVRSNGSGVGSIQQTADGNGTTFNTSSDYRLKESISYEFDATTRLKQLKPCRFVFKESLTGQTVDGFLAHEVSSIVPDAVSGTKDEIDLDGNAKYQGIDHSKLVPLLVKTIQELEARITTLEGE